MSGPTHACFGMYPFKPLRPAWERLVSALHDRVPWVPPGLDWSEDVHDAWVDRNCVVAHACGWPIVTSLTDQVRVVGAFSLTSEGATGHRYRSVLVAPEHRPLDELVADRVSVAANSADSLSGWVSLLVGTGVGTTWPGDVHWTGAHALSLAAVRARRAGLACIDGHTFAHLRRIDPAIDTDVAVVGYGPDIPSPAVVVRHDAGDRTVAELRAGLADVLADPSLAADRATLLLDGFVPLDDDEYGALGSRWPALFAAHRS